MTKADTVKTRRVYVNLDKTYEIAFTMRVLFEIENKFETASRGLQELFGERDVDAAAFILSAAAGIPLRQVKPLICADNISDLKTRVLEAVICDFPDGEPDGERAERGDGKIDWDFLLYFTRVKLRFSEREFWRATPRALSKYIALYAQGISGGAELSPQTAFIDELDF